MAFCSGLEYAFGLIGNGESGVGKSDSPRSPIPNVPIPDSRFTQHDLLNRAADYFAQARKPRTEWKKLDDLAAQLAEFELRCAADDYDTAASVLTSINFDYLTIWGHYKLSIQLLNKLQNKINDSELRRIIIGHLGIAYNSIGDIQEAIKNYNIALNMAREEKNQGAESAWLGNLSIAYMALGNIQKSIEFDEKSLEIKRSNSDELGEGNSLARLGNCYFYLGDSNKAIDFFEQALSIHRKIRNQSGEASDLGNIGLALINRGKYLEAIDFFLQSIQIGDMISYTDVQSEERWGLAQVYLFQNDLVNARATIEAALKYDEPQNNHNATALHGIIALRQGERESAQEAFTKSIAQADEILAKTPEYYSALDAKGLSICGLTICDLRMTIGARGREELLAEAVKTFKRAREIAPHAGVVKSVLRLFDELVKCEEEGILKEVRNAAEGK